MPDDIQAQTPATDAGQVTESTGVQPQTDPQTPDTGQVADNQINGTTNDGDRGQREAFYQKQYQALMQTHKGLSAELEQYQKFYGNVPESKPTNEPAQSKEPDGEYDIYTPEGMAAFRDSLTQGVVGEVSKVLAQREAQQRAEAQHNAEFEVSRTSFLKWINDNKIPEDIAIAAYKQVSAELPKARPSVLFKYISNEIYNKTMLDSQAKFMADKVADATTKAKALNGVIQPEPGTAPPVKPALSKTPEQVATDKFKPAGKKSFDKLWES